MWVNADDGFNTRIDPQTNKPTGRIGKFTPGGAGNYCQGLGAGGGAVWSCLKTGVTRIDPTRMRITATIPIAKAFDQGKLVFMDGRIWVITGPTGNQLVGIDTTTNQPGPPITLPFGCDDLAWGGTSLWVLCPRANHVVKVDVAHRSIQGTLALAQTYEGAATRHRPVGRIKPGARSRQRHNPQTRGDLPKPRPRPDRRRGRRRRPRLGQNHRRFPAPDRRHASNTIVEQITVPPGSAEAHCSIAAGSIWTTADDAGLSVAPARRGLNEDANRL